jgi:methylenetetrahydrofolate reductase (NADPH)
MYIPDASVADLGMNSAKSQDIRASALSDFLDRYSTEVTPGDRKSIDVAGHLLESGTEVFVVSLPSDSAERQIDAAVRLRRAGLKPVPHIAARNIASRFDLDNLLRRLTVEAEVDRVLVLSGDRDKPAGDLVSSLQILESGLIEKHGIRSVAISAYPEGHPKIADALLLAARHAKLEVARRAGLAVTFVSQFCFDPAPIIGLARQLRAQGIKESLRVGVAGPASRTSLLKFALLCGVGPSIRALKERPLNTRSLLARDTPTTLLNEIVRAQHLEPSLGIDGVHIFSFASIGAAANWVREVRVLKKRRLQDS